MTRIIIIAVLAAAFAWTAYYFYTMQSSERAKTDGTSSGLTQSAPALG